MVRHALAIALFLLASALPAWALEGLTPRQEAALERTVARFDRAMRAENYSALFDFTPPKVRAEIARQYGVSQSRMKREMSRQVRAATAAMTIEDFEMHMDRAQARTLRDGTPYVVIPNRTRVRAGGKVTTVRSHAIAILDGGRWYLIRAKEQRQIQILRRAYPAFAGVRLPR